MKKCRALVAAAKASLLPWVGTMREDAGGLTEEAGSMSRVVRPRTVN